MSYLEKKNTVPSANQVKKPIFFDGCPNGSPRVMFVGNSVTYHGIKEDIGWYGSWGMAASKKDKDYVHLIMKHILDKYPDASFCIVQASCWERSYKNCDYDEHFSLAKDFVPDVIICNVSANIPMSEFDKDAFKEGLKNLYGYFCKDNKEIKIFQGTSIFNNDTKTQAIVEFGKENNVTVVDVSEVSNDKSNLAYDEFEHEGIQVHPGDKGMALLAELFIEKLAELKF